MHHQHRPYKVFAYILCSPDVKATKVGELFTVRITPLADKLQMSSFIVRRCLEHLEKVGLLVDFKLGYGEASFKINSPFIK